VIRGIGTDIVAVSRVEALSATNDGRFLTRWFTAAELAYCQGKAHPARHLAARLAAKESVAKALRLSRDHRLGWHDIEVTLDPEGAPDIAVHGGLAGEVPAGCRWHVSLSHSDDHATAVAVLEEGR
jgi:holo-[acyl-carrier protein] synthase